MLRYIKKADFLLIILTIFCISISFIALKVDNSSVVRLQIKSPTAEYIYPIEKDNTISVSGKIGVSQIVIKNKQVYFQDSPCKNHTCTLCKPIEKPNEWTACLPNGIIIRIINSEESFDEFDAIGF